MNTYENVAVLSGLGDVNTDGSNQEVFGPFPEGYYRNSKGELVWNAPMEVITGRVPGEPISYGATLEEKVKDAWAGVLLGKPAYVAGAAAVVVALGAGAWFLFNRNTEKVTVMSGYSPKRRRKSRRKSRRGSRR